MKKIATIFLVIAAGTLHGQNLQEWIHQKKTQIEYLVDQVAALQVYTGYMEKGYDIARNGLTAINNIKNGDFSLHDHYFNSLASVNPTIKGYWKVADMMALQITILQSCRKQRNTIVQSGRFTAGEINYSNTVFANLLNGCRDIIDQLIVVITDQNLQMKDDERIKRIDALHADMEDKYVFVQHFASEENILAASRLADSNDVRVSRALLNSNE